MRMGEATMRALQVEPSIWMLELAGELTGEAEKRLTDALASALQGGASAIVLDFGGLDRIDGGGFALLVGLGVRVSRQQKRLLAFGLSPRCRALFEEFGLGAAISFHPSREKALRGAGSRHPAGAGGEASRQDADREACPAAHWAGPMGRAHVPSLSGRESRLNVEGHRIRGPLDGFGQLWQKRYTVRLAGAGVTPAEVVQLCAERLNDFWPPGNRVHFPPPGVVPGAVGFIELHLPGGVPLRTGMRVLHAAESSFTFVSLSGHMEAGIITFSAREENGCTVFQVQSLARTGDPLYEIGFALFGHAEQERFWRMTLEALARHYKVPPLVRISRTCLDERRQWAAVGNVMANAAARTSLTLGASLLSRLLSPGKR
jgi:anti-anti-sigma factor